MSTNLVRMLCLAATAITLVGCGGGGAQQTGDLVTVSCDFDNVLLGANNANQCTEFHVKNPNIAMLTSACTPGSFTIQACRTAGSLGRCDNVKANGYTVSVYLFDDGLAVDATGAQVECNNLGGKFVLPADYNNAGGNPDLGSDNNHNQDAKCVTGSSTAQQCGQCCADDHPTGSKSAGTAFLVCSCKQCSSDCNQSTCGTFDDTSNACVTCETNASDYCDQHLASYCPSADTDCKAYSACRASCATAF